jgi:hypothetical protein
MVKYKPHHAMKSDRNILIHALKNEKPLVPGKKMAKWLSSEFMQHRDDIILLEECRLNEDDLDNTWFIAYNSPLGICLFELTDSLLEKSNYGIES